MISWMASMAVTTFQWMTSNSRSLGQAPNSDFQMQARHLPQAPQIQHVSNGILRKESIEREKKAFGKNFSLPSVHAMLGYIFNNPKGFSSSSFLFKTYLPFRTRLRPHLSVVSSLQNSPISLSFIEMINGLSKIAAQGGHK